MFAAVAADLRCLPPKPSGQKGKSSRSISPSVLSLRRAAKARENGLSNLEFKTEDMLALGYPDASFDVVVCVFGIFFVPDMVAATNELWRMLRPGGRLAITTWGPDLFEPANTAFWEAIREERPELREGFQPMGADFDPCGAQPDAC